MTLASEHVETDTRERILVVAERLFRQIGYQKTTVADIAKELRMSPANVYRFFDSKKAIHEGVARGLMGEVEDRGAGGCGQAQAGGCGEAAGTDDHDPSHEQRTLRRRFQAARDGRRSRWRKSWEVCVAHMEQITGTIGSVIAEGAASGEFNVVDVPLAAMCACTAMMRFFHPQMIAQCVDKPGPSIDQMIDFVVAGLVSRAKEN